MNEQGTDRAFDCPDCQKKIRPIWKVEITGAFCGEVKKGVSGSDREILCTKKFKCPHCGRSIQARYKMTVIDVIVVPENSGARTVNRKGDRPKAAIPAAPLAPLTESEQTLLAMYKDSVIFTTYEEIVRDTYGSQQVDVGRHFLQFLQTADRINVPRKTEGWAINEIGGRIEFWACNGTAMIVSSGRIDRIVPTVALMNPEQQPGRLVLHGRTVTLGDRTVGDLRKTQRGLVPASCPIFMDELLRSVGRNLRPIYLRRD